MNETISGQLKTIAAFCQNYPHLIEHLDEFPKLYDFSIKYSTLIEHEDEIDSICKFMREYKELVLHADEALAAYRFIWKLGLDCDMDHDELEAILRLAQILRGNPEAEDNENADESSPKEVVEPTVETGESEDIDNILNAISAMEEVETEMKAEAKSEAEVIETEAEVKPNIKTTKTRIPASERRAMTETENKKLQELAERGYSHRQIGQMIGCARYYVNNVLSGKTKTWPIVWIKKLNELDLDNLPEKPNNHSHSPKKKPQNADEAPEEPA